MKEKLNKFFYGRYGQDGLNKFVYIISLILLGVFFLTRSYIPYFIAIALMVICLYRSFSKDIGKRSSENYQYYIIKNNIKNFFSRKKNRVKNMGTYSYFKCPNCSADMKAPKNKGKIKVTCQNCRNVFYRET